MKVLVTGATGFVGRHVVARLLARGHEVIAVSRDEAKARKFAWFERVRFVACDIHAQAGNPVERFGHPQAVMHLAWPGLPNYGALFHHETTLPADYRFLKSLVLGGVGHLLVTGTCFEYGKPSGALSEDLPTAPANPYALAKDTLRKQLQSLGRQHAFTLQWARLFYMYGEGQSSNSLLAQLDRAIDSREAVFNMSGGEQLRDYLPVDEVAARCVTLLEHPSCDGVVNICSGEPISVRRLAERHLANRGAKIRLNLGHYPYSSEEPMAFWGDASRLAAILPKL
ncbi:MAG: NAD-dependent epimerase/dehydratase family protein [Proteobacteria bacterium]|nr:NAD-dependent epimerase/dehydratase family protein [Pseudomonadota bacterium]